MANEKWFKNNTSHPFKSLELMKFSSSIISPRTQAFYISALPPMACQLLSSDLSPRGLSLIAADPVITSPHTQEENLSQHPDSKFPSGSHSPELYHLLMPKVIIGQKVKSLH